MTDLLAPNERLMGTPEQRHALAVSLQVLRAVPCPRPRAAHRGLRLVTLPEFLADPRAAVDADLLCAGLRIAQRRYEQHGRAGLLPAERVWIGAASSDTAAFGGFHFPGQGYRHWQMAAVITRYGDLAGGPPSDPRLAALDLLRAYAHDSLHYSTHRAYQWHITATGIGIVRTRYGINFRRPDGRTYSGPDEPGCLSTRNLGIVMEGATDHEACVITRQAADAAGIAEPATDLDFLEFREVTGRLTPADFQARPITLAAAGGAGRRAFLARMASYHSAVGARYGTFLAEVSPAAPDELHAAIIASMISGSLAELSHRLDELCGPAAFRRLFKTSSYTRPGLAA